MNAEIDSLDALLRSCADRLARRKGSLFDTAEAERVSPLLYYWFLCHGFPDTLSQAERQRFRKTYYRSAGRNVELLSALSELASVLGNHGIACVALKGADLARHLYPNVALRPMGDVDVYVPEEDASRAEAVLVACGYRPWSPDMTRGLSRRIRHARLYVGGRNDTISIDLHWSLVGHGADARAPERDWIERNTITGGLGSPSRLSETAHLLYLAAHMKLQHYDEAIPLLWLIDFHRLSTSGAIHWDELFAGGARFGWNDALRSCAFDVRERLGVALPPVLEQAAKAAAPGLHREDARNEPRRGWNEMRTLSWSGRLALVRAYVLPSPSYVRYRYPPATFLPSWAQWAWPAGYLIRWFTLARKTMALTASALRPRGRARPLLTRRETC